MKYEAELNENQSLEEIYKQKFENDVSWKQSNIGLCVKIAGHFPPETHNANNDIPPLFTNRKITKVSKINKKGYKNEPLCVRLVASLLPIGEKYKENNWKNIEVFHYMELKIALSRGFVIDFVGESLWFDQAPILRDFCDRVQAWRRESKTEFEKSFYKLILNSLYDEHNKFQ